MIIESSNIELNSTSSSKTTHTHTVEKNFSQELTTANKLKQQGKFINEAGMIDQNIKVVTSSEKQLCVHDLMIKFIVENLLDKLLGKTKEQDNSKSVKLYPYDDNKITKDTGKTVLKNFSMTTTYEYSKTNLIKFDSKAIIKTKDKEINIDLNIQYTQKFYEKHQTKIEQQRAVYIDPLIIQFDIEAKKFDLIDDTLTFTFDINSDGYKEKIPYLNSGSGFLALDKNNNLTIDDGSELFGTTSNDGFNDLKAYDKDDNDWIDENDEIFKDLRIWYKTKFGKDELIALGDANIGAIYLNDINTQFYYDKDIQQNIAKLNSSSIFITDDEKIGILGAVDFVKN